MSFFTLLSGSRPRVPLYGLLVLSFLLLSGTSHAQVLTDISLYSVSTDDGNLSMFLPIGWTFIDDLDATTSVAFGDSEEAAQTRLEALGTSLQTQTIIGAGGTFQFYEREALDLTDESTVEDLKKLVNDVVTELDATDDYYISQNTQAVTLRSGDAAYAVIRDDEDVEFIACLFYGGYVGYAVIGAPADDFDRVASQLIAVLDSVRIPGETLLTMPDSTQGVSTYNDLFSIRVPRDWTYQFVDLPIMKDAVAFGSSMRIYDDAAEYIRDGRPGVLSTAGIGGFVGLLEAEVLEEMNTDAKTVYDGQEEAFKTMLSVTSKPWTIPGIDAQGVLYYGYEKGDSHYETLYVGRINGIMIIGDDVLELVLWVNPSHDFRRSVPLLEGIIASLTFPAIKDSEIASFGSDASFTPTPFDMSAQTPDEDGMVDFVSRNHQVSVRLPAEWIINERIDRIRSLDTLTFGETKVGADTRESPSKFAEDIGGSLSLSTYRDLGLMPYPSNSGLLNYLYRWMDENSATVLQKPQVITVRGKRIAYAIYQRNTMEWGFVAVHDFGSRFVVTRVSAPSQEIFDENTALLGAIVDSVAVPATQP